MTDQEFILFLYRHGHFWNPAYPDVLNVTEADLPSLSLDDRVVQLAVASYQMSDANLRPLALTHHHRDPVFDGLVGPATMELAGFDRCPMPDFPPPPNATFHYDDPDLQRAVETYQATGSGSWPAGCHGTPSVHEVKISYDLRNMSAKQREWWPEIKARSHAAMADVGVRMIEVPVGQKANITVYGKVLGGSVIGLAQFNNGSCGDTVFCQISPNYGPDIDQVLVLVLHENGHNWNLEHRAGNIMNPSILRAKTYWIKRLGSAVEYQDNSYPTLKKFFGGEALTPPTPPGPPVGECTVRLGRDLPAGVHGDFTLGSLMKAGDYRLYDLGDQVTPVNPG